MSKWIYLPADSGSNSEFLHQELMPNHHVVNLIFIVSASLIMHAPASIDKLKATLLDQRSHLRLHIFCLKAPPHAEEFHFNIGESLWRVIHQWLDHSIKDQVDTSLSHVILSASEILINGLEPANIVMSMCDHMNCDVATISMFLTKLSNIRFETFMRFFAQLSKLRGFVLLEASLVSAVGPTIGRAKQEHEKRCRLWRDTHF